MRDAKTFLLTFVFAASYDKLSLVRPRPTRIQEVFLHAESKRSRYGLRVFGRECGSLWAGYRLPVPIARTELLGVTVSCVRL